MIETLQEMLNETVASIFLMIVGLVVAYASLYINKLISKATEEINKIQGEKEQGLLKAALDQVDALATTTVKALEQTVAQDIRAEVQSGNMNRESLLNLSSQAAAKVYTNMKPEYLNALEQSMGNVYDYVNDLIESKVLDIKSKNSETVIISLPEEQTADTEEASQLIDCE